MRDRTSYEVHSVVGPHRGALEPRPFRRAARGQGLPRHTAPPRPGVFRPAMSRFDPDGLDAPAPCPELVAPPVVLGPTPISDLALVRQAAADPFIPSISSVPAALHRRCRAGPSLSASTSATPRATATPLSSPASPSPEAGIGSIGLWLQRDREWARLHRLLARRRRAWAGAWRPPRCVPVVVPSRSARSSHPAPASLRRALERGVGPDGRGGRLQPGGHVAGLGAHRRRNSTMRIATPSCTPTGPARTEGARVRPLRDCPGVRARPCDERSPSASTT